MLKKISGKDLTCQVVSCSDSKNYSWANCWTPMTSVTKQEAPTLLWFYFLNDFYRNVRGASDSYGRPSKILSWSDGAPFTVHSWNPWPKGTNCWGLWYKLQSDLFWNALDPEAFLNEFFMTDAMHFQGFRDHLTRFIS